MRIRFYVAAALAVLLLASGANAQKRRPRLPDAARRADFFPLRVGDSWTYHHDEGSTFTVKVLSMEKQADGTMLYLVEQESVGKIDFRYSKSDLSVLLHSETYPGQEGLNIKFDPPKQVLKLPLNAGATLNWTGKDITGMDLKESSKVIGPEVVEVPAGKFRAMKVVSEIYTGEARMVKTNWYADGVGLIKSETAAPKVNYGWQLIDYSFKQPGRRNKRPGAQHRLTIRAAFI